MNMDEYAGKGESRNHWLSEDEQQAKTGKGEGRNHLSSAVEQQARTGKGEHSKY